MIKRTACLIARGTDPYHNLAVEKHLMDTLPKETAILYLWQNQHAIVIGRNQNPWYECRVEEFLESGGKIARRLSGGGAVYYDLGNLNFTFIVPKAEFDIARQVSVVAMAVDAFGIPVEMSGRNDLYISGCKLSGNSFYKAGHSAYHHGTLLMDCNLDEMALYLTANPGRFQQQAMNSTPGRLVNLKSLCPEIDVRLMQEALFHAFGKIYRQTPAMLDEYMLDGPTLERITDRFEDHNWVYPAALPYGFTVSERFPWGGVTVKLQVEGGVIRAAKIFTDAMEATLFDRVEQGLTGSPYLISAIGNRLEQKLDLLTDAALRQIAGDVCALICGKMRAMDRGYES
ncbi:MAG: lipoate--protein ligase [Clostridia bacterium]|nr:lipoate--protein ligase [Clostridia bacterium]